MSKTAPLISVIIPTYNRKELLEKAIFSVINQQKGEYVFDYEILIVDDGSTDGTRNYIATLLAQHDTIRYFYQENSGLPGKARNVALAHMSPQSDWTILLDDDDEFIPDLFIFCLRSRQQLKEEQRYDQVLWFYFLCQNEHGQIVGSKDILQGKQERIFTYDDYLLGAINREMGLITKSHIFFGDQGLRFSEEVITEWVMWCRMRQLMERHQLVILLRDYVGRLYRTSHTWQIQITKTFTKTRFLKNAQGNEQIFATIADDLDRKWFMHIKSEYDMRIGINYLLGWERQKWLQYMNAALQTFPSFKICLLRIIVHLLPRQCLHVLYVKYVS